MEFTIEQLNTAIANISKAQARASKEIGSVLLMCLYFANVKKDAGAANALLKCLRKSTKQAGIVALLEKHGKLGFLKDKKVFAFFDATTPEWDAESVKTLRVVCAAWEDFKPAVAKVEEYDLESALHRLLDKADKMKAEGVKVNGEALIAAVNAAIAATMAPSVS